MTDKPDGNDHTDPAVADTQASDAGSVAEARDKRAPRSIRSGDVLGRYEISDELGEGGMATVFRARDRELRRDVAVKIMFPHLARRPEIVQRFHREARAAAGLEHPNILRIYDVGGADGDDPPYIVMEMIRGRTLLQELEQRGPVLAEIVACIGALLADALAAAHAAGIIHRDIKPANVLIAPGGRLLLADFGVARLETEDSLVTKTGALLGTPAYMSPEQAAGDIATTKSDLYSLGATLYQLATGSLPYSGTAAKVMAQIATGALVAPVRRRPAVGPDLSRIIERLMATDATLRPATAASIAAELRALAVQGAMGDPTDELAGYFADPEGFVRRCTPAIVTTLIWAAHQASTDGRSPRAMALAERANALAPQDPQVAQLIHALAEGGRAKRRRRGLALAALGLAASGATGAFVYTRIGRAPELPAVVATLDGALAGDGALVASRALPLDAAELAEPADAAPADAPIARSRADAGTRPSHAAAVPTGADASIALVALADAAVVAAPADAAADATAVGSATVIVTNDVWCDIAIDGVAKGRARGKPLVVEPGHHVVTCTQPGLDAWKQDIDVAAGGTRTVAGKMLATFDITVGSKGGATIDGLPYSRGSTAKLKAGRHNIRVGTEEKYISISRACTVRESPQLDCF